MSTDGQMGLRLVTSALVEMRHELSLAMEGCGDVSGLYINERGLFAHIDTSGPVGTVGELLVLCGYEIVKVEQTDENVVTVVARYRM